MCPSTCKILMPGKMRVWHTLQCGCDSFGNLGGSKGGWRTQVGNPEKAPDIALECLLLFEAALVAAKVSLLLS